MAITLTGTSSGNQGLFNRLGRFAPLLAALDTLRATTLPGGVEDVLELFDGGSTTVRNSVAAVLDVLATLTAANDPEALLDAAQAILTAQVNADNPLPDPESLEAAIAELIKQMKTAGDKVAANAITAAATQTSLNGDGVVVISKKDGFGRALENLLAEDLECEVEDETTIRVRGEPEAERTSHLWPAGSGSDATYSPIQADGSGTLLINGGNDTFTVANTPDNWEIVVGTVDTTIFSEASILYKAGGKSLKITGTGGAQLTALRQELAGLSTRTNYGLNVWLRMSAMPSAGVWKYQLHDGTSVLTDEEGNNCELAVDLTALGTSWVNYNTSFRLAEPLPETVYLKKVLTTAIESGKSLYEDHLALAELEHPSDDGRTPAIGFFEGSAPWAIGDGEPDGTTVFKIVTTNDGDGEWQRLFERLFAMTELGLVLPTTGGGSTISETLLA